MGWSCRADAGNVMNRMSNACYKNSGSSNVWKDAKGNSYFFEVSRREHRDGAITGKVLRMSEKTADGRFLCKESGSIRIEGDGTVSRAPKFLKDAALDSSNDR